ncbi:MAG: TonB family protein [Crocinitomicaceae bacterium]|nr:TonB family protein [Crocinitomicaceae bacterium]
MKTKLLIIFFSLSLICENNAKANHLPHHVSRAIHTWISENVQYPQQAINTQDEGTVYVAFEIDQHGALVNVHIEEGVSVALNEAAMKLVLTLPLHELVPGETNCAGSYVIPIKFEII